jgi:signal transduction histidine kinase
VGDSWAYTCVYSMDQVGRTYDIAKTDKGIAPGQRAIPKLLASMINALFGPEHPRVGIPRDPQRFLRWCFSSLRLATIGVLLLVTLMQPAQGRFGLALEFNILIFAGYTLAMEVVRARVNVRAVYTWICILDLPVVLGLYALGAAPGGLLFVLVFLAVVCAAISMSIRASLVYTFVILVSLSIIDPTLPLWLDQAGDVRRLSGRLIMLGLLALGFAVLTHRLRIEQAVARSSQDEATRLAETERLRSEFAAMVSHDLRTPLAGASAGIGMLEIHAYERLTPDERELLASTRRSIGRLGRSIEDLLLLHQLDAGALQFSLDVLDLRQTVTDVLPLIHPLITHKGQTLEVDLPKPLMVHADARRMEHALINLLANAHQHTPTGTRIMVAGTLQQRHVVLTVSDNGPGIPQDEHELVFERFYQLTERRGNSGLGLAIVKAIVERQGGRVWVESPATGGVAFFLELPHPPEQASV